MAVYDISGNVVSNNANGNIFGGVFIFTSYNKIHVICESTAKAFLNGTPVNIANQNYEFNKPETGTYYIVLQSDGFSLKELNSDFDYIVAEYSGDSIYKIDQNIYVQTLPITNLRKRVNIPLFVNNKRIPNYNVKALRNNSKITNYGYFYKLLEDYGVKEFAYQAVNGSLIECDATVTKNTSSIASKTVLCIGDSVTRRGWFQDRLYSYVSTLSFVGTQACQFSSNNFTCEGYSGQTAKKVLASSTVSQLSTSMANPFWDSSLGKCTMEHYCTTQNVHPDIVIIEFGLNEINPDEYYESISNFIATVKEYDSSIKIYVIQPFNSVNTIGYSNSTSDTQVEACNKCVLYSYEFTDCTLIPCWYIMVDEYDYAMGTASYGYDNTEVAIASDGVHPKQSVGFAKLGDMIYNYLGL